METESVINIRSVEQSYEYLDSIPTFETSLREISEISLGRGRIPAMWQWFEPENEHGNLDMAAIYNKKGTKEFLEWGLGKRILKIFDYWKENDFDLPFYLNLKSRDLLSEWDKTGKLERNLEMIDSRGVGAHVVRLLTHEQAPACIDFAMAVMTYLPEIDPEKFKDIYFSEIGDGDEQAQFWTFGPYVYEALKSNRVVEGKNEDDKQDFLKVLLWLRGRKRIVGQNGNSEFPGIKGLGREMQNLYLSKNGFHPVHKFAEKVGEHIASYLKKIKVDEGVIFDQGDIRRV